MNAATQPHVADRSSWMSPGRKALEGDLLAWLHQLHGHRAWCLDAAGELFAYRGSAECEAAMLVCSLGGHVARMPTIFDIALDALADARNPVFVDAVAWGITRVVHGSDLARFDAEVMTLGQRLADWRRGIAAVDRRWSPLFVRLASFNLEHAGP